MKVLVAEDDTNIREGLIEILTDEGYEVIAASDGQKAVEEFERAGPDFVCLDIMMPELSGYDVCRAIRRQNESIPIIFITAKSEEIDKVLGLELGADDFITKPFGVKEVVARIRAVSRRCLARTPAPSRQTRFCMGDLEILPLELRARRGDTTMDLSLRDIKLLELFFERAGEAVSRDEIFNRCWGLDHVPNSRTLDQHISQLRKRIEKDAKNPVLIRTVHGVGYRYDPVE
jgi:DNA-binding response OmpR family regulator